ncbi:hypothetical protein CYMTET_9977 [Cymbomonas tetramitiformis]|uniref:Mitochondrial glycoprotein n=1 Tax=Cymbomonas tetramitiformis TaxID=36881 RepID=A0AAE0GQ71_9CHLO|nr:hypothetical protein CYMTET_9977 [Cymbomonas tetramitiformis]
MYRQRSLITLISAVRQYSTRTVLNSCRAPVAVAQDRLQTYAAALTPRTFVGRTFASSAVNPADQELAGVLASEISNEKETFEPSQLKPPAPFKLVEKENDCFMELTRSFGKDETVTIRFLANDQEPHEMTPDEEEEMEEQDLSAIYFTVEVNKPDSKKTLTFECVTNGEGIELRAVSLGANEDAGTEDEYTGPDFHELDEKLQENFDKYLEARGVNPELTAFIVEIASDKEQRLYMNWLDSMNKFIGN